jgi:hypothetical protein
MKPQLDHRKSKRFEHKATVMLKDVTFGYICYGKMINYSDGGMLIESDTPFKHGTHISVTLDKPVYKAAPTTYLGTVKWCRECLIEDLRYHYGLYGVGIGCI